MRSLTARFLALAALVPALVLFAVVPGCAKQNEGERCGDESQPLNDDCADGLTCTKIVDSSNIYRCCYSNGTINDSRCEIPDSPSGSSGGSSGSGGAAAAGNSSEAGASPDGG